MAERRKLVAILCSDVVGYSRLAGADEESVLARLRTLRAEVMDPVVATHDGRVFKRTGDGTLVEFRSVVEAVRCAVAIQSALIDRNHGHSPDDRIELRIGVHVGDVVEEADGDLMGDGVNIAARLESVAAPGTIRLSDDAYRQVRDRLNLAFTDLGPTELKNIVRPMRTFEVKIGSESAAPAPRRRVSEGLGAPRLSIVVLPFANIGVDSDQEYFVDGVTESLTTDLSRMSGMLVIGRNTAFTYKGKAVNLRQIGRELNVRYALVGSVQRGRDRMRVNVELIDAESGNNLWAERFDKPLADLFDMQDEIVARLAGQLGTRLIAAEARRSELAPIPDSMDLHFRGMTWLNKGATPESLKQARALFVEALALDSGNIEALVGSALVDVFAEGNFITDREPVSRAEAALHRVLSLAPEHALARAWLGRIQIGSKRAPQGIAECERALALDRNLASAHAFIGLGKSAVGRAEETESHVQDALRLSPRDTFSYRWFIIAGFAKLSLGLEEGGAEWLHRSIEANRNAPIAHFGLAAARALLGRLSEAKSAVQAGYELDPTFTVQRFRAGAASDNSVFLARRERIYEGMRLAGVAED